MKTTVAERNDDGGRSVRQVVVRLMTMSCLTVGVLALAGCGPPEGGGQAEALPVLTLGDPALEIGVIEGDDELVFGALESVIRLPNGMVAVSDGGATRVSLFQGDGAFVHSWGSRGDGPGEFRSLSRIYPLGDDSLMAAERHSGRLAVFDLEGEFGRLLSGPDLTGDSVFALDSWLVGRFWVDGALTAHERQAALALLEAYAVPAEWPGYRYVLAGSDGRLWIREKATDPARHTWTRVGPDGPDAVIHTPAAFRPTHIPSSDEVLGVWSGESGVHFARVYGVSATEESVPSPAWLTHHQRAEPDPDTPMTEDELMAEIRSSIKQMASAQEIHYSTAMTYTTDLAALEAFEQPEAVVVDFVRADARGWAGGFSHASIDRIGGLAHGFGTPPGWTPGMVICAPDTTLEPTEEGTDS